MSEVQRQTMRQAGAIRRISVAVLVDGITTIGADGARSWAPRPAEEVQALRQLVIAAVGFDEARGDIVTIESMEFEPDDQIGALVEVSSWTRLLERNTMTLIQIGALSLVALVLALTVIKPLLTRRAPEGLAIENADAQDGISAPNIALGMANLSTSDDFAGAGNGGGSMMDSGTAEPNGEALRLAVAERPEQSATMLREWLSTQPARSGREAA